jgi:hypothetical protein
VKTGLKCWVLAWLLILNAGMSSVQGAATRGGSVSEVFCELAHIRQIGVRKDRAQLQVLLHALQRKPDSNALFRSKVAMPALSAPLYWHWQTALLIAFARLEDARSLPDLMALRSKPGWKDHPYLIPAIARIKASVAVPRVRTAEDWRRKVAVFLQECKGGDDSQSRHQAICTRFLAEMASEAYAAGVREAFRVLNEAGIDWQSDSVASWIVELGQRTGQERAEWLLARLRTATAIRVELYYDLQALADCGEIAVKLLMGWWEELSQSATSNTDSPAIEVRRALCLQALAAIDHPAARAFVEKHAEGRQLFLAQPLEGCPMVFTSSY